MSDDDKSKDKPAPAPPPPARDVQINVRLDRKLHKDAKEKARPYGGVSAVIRAMLRAFVNGERNFDIEDLAEENTPSTKPTPPKRKKK